MISPRRKFSTIELLRSAAFMGFEVSVLEIGLSVVLNSIPIVVEAAIVSVSLMLA